MKKKAVLVLVLVLALTYQVAMAWFDPPTWTYTYTGVTTQNPTTATYYGEGRTGDGRGYITATCSLHENYVIRDRNDWMQLVPNLVGAIGAPVSYIATRPVDTTVFIEAHSWHEAADLPSGADKGVAADYASEYYTFGGKSPSSIEEAHKATGLLSLFEYHEEVRQALEIDAESHVYFSYQNVHELLNGKVALIKDDSQLTGSLANALVRTIAQHAQVGDLGAGMWFNPVDKTCIVGVRKADGSFLGVHLALSDQAEDATWCVSEVQLVKQQ